MKVKYRLDDFVVEEVLKEGLLGGKGYMVFRIRKEGIDTFELMNAISKKFRVRREAITTCGLKDKYSVSFQYLAVREEESRGKLPRRIFGIGFEGEYVGRASVPLTSSFILKNKFRIVLRDIHPDEVKIYEDNLWVVGRQGFPNYYDDQRFGSARHGRGFIAKKIIEGDFEEALKIHFQAVSQEDRSRVKKFKKHMERFWGGWFECLKEAQSSQDKKILSYLVKNPGNFKGALKLLDRRLLRLYLEAYQSYIWNEVLRKITKRFSDGTYEFPYNVGNFEFPIGMSQANSERLKTLKIPLPHRDVNLKGGILKEVFDEVLNEESISLGDFKTHLNVDFVKSTRLAWVVPEGIAWNISDDEYHEGSLKITIGFSLPPGSFATMLIKRVTPLEPKSDTAKKPKRVMI